MIKVRPRRAATASATGATGSRRRPRRRAATYRPIVLATASVVALTGSLSTAQAAPETRPSGSSMVAAAPASAGPECDPRSADAELDRFARGRQGRPERPDEARCAGTYRHPLQALAGRAGPVPLFDQLDDPSGRRYVVGEESTITAEDGRPTVRSGLYAVGSGVATRTKSDPRPDLTQPPKITADLQRAIERAGEGTAHEVVVTAASPGAGLQVRLERLIAEGKIRTRADYDSAGDRLRSEQAAVNQRSLGSVAVAISGTGGRVVFTCANLPCLTATLSGDGIRQLARRSDIVEIDIPRVPVEDGMSGTEVRTGTQLRQFLDSPYHFDGNGVSETNESDNVVVAVVESNGFAEHDGYRENAGGYFRHATGEDSTGRWECATNTPCVSVDAFASPGNHATGAAGLLFGDLMDNQLAGVPSAEREGGSGYAPEARAHLYDFSSGTDALDHIAGLSSAQRVPDLVSNSWSLSEGGPRCGGLGGQSQSANRLYKDGIAVFKSASNSGGSSTDCRVGAPGAAVGVFTVGAHMSFPNSDAADVASADANTVRQAGIYDSGGNQSSWGGNLAQGQGRSLIDLTGPGERTDKFNTSGGLSDSGVICCTGHATPTVAGHAASFMDFYQATYSNFIDHPGSLYASMLLMGDRQGVSGKVADRADHRWGMGRVRMRKFDANGMDAPWTYFNGWTCVSHGKTVQFPVMDGAKLPADMNDFKAAAYWFDYRHDGSDLSGNAGKVADVDLAVVDVDRSLILGSDIDPYDNKARVYTQNIGDRRLNLELSGESVFGHTDPVCGANSMRVFFTFFAEDSDRESLPFNSFTGEGIFPEYK